MVRLLFTNLQKLYSSNALKLVLFLLNGKWAIIVPIHKNVDKQTPKNYHPVSLLPICGKILERLLLNEMFKFLLKINLLHQISLVLNPLILALIRCYLSLMRYMDLLMWGLKLEAFSLIYPKYLIRCGMTVSSSS